MKQDHNNVLSRIQREINSKAGAKWVNWKKLQKKLVRSFQHYRP